MIAYERVQIKGGIIRYRTAHGWISEFQRDTKKYPLATLLDITDSLDEEQQEKEDLEEKQDNQESKILKDFETRLEVIPHLDNQGNNENENISPSSPKLLESCTLRDGVCYLLSRLHNSLQYLAGQIKSHKIVLLKQIHDILIDYFLQIL